eukprot:gene36704-44525_t
MSALPVLFLSHGGGPAHLLDFGGTPFSAMDKNSRSADFMRNLSQVVKAHSSTTDIKCILVVSAHWEENSFTVDYQPSGTKLIYDYYGFPDESYAPHLTYPVPTDLAVADRVAALLQQGGIVSKKANRGFDHGTFIPLKVAYPAATIPVVQLSLKRNLDLAEHVRVGELLQPLRKEGVLIIGSGQITHNLSAMRSSPNNGAIDPKVSAFTDYVNNFLEATSTGNYAEQKVRFAAMPSTAPHYAFNHPRDEHFVPLAVAFGAAFGSTEAVETKAIRVYHEIVLGNMAVDSYLFSSL